MYIFWAFCLNSCVANVCSSYLCIIRIPRRDCWGGEVWITASWVTEGHISFVHQQRWVVGGQTRSACCKKNTPISFFCVILFIFCLVCSCGSRKASTDYVCAGLNCFAFWVISSRKPILQTTISFQFVPESPQARWKKPIRVSTFMQLYWWPLPRRSANRLFPVLCFRYWRKWKEHFHQADENNPWVRLHRWG